MIAFPHAPLIALVSGLAWGGPNLGLCTTDPSTGFLWCSGQRLFILAVGVNDYGSMRFQFAEHDAQRVAVRFQRDYGRSDSTVTQIVITGRAATKEAVARAFELAVRTLRTGDVFIFYFAGHSTTGSPDSRFGASTQLAFAGATYPNPSPDAIVDTRQLKVWLDNIGASRQLVIMDAGQTEGFFEEFVATVSVGDPLVADLTRRNRIIVAPRWFGLEKANLGGGVLTFMLLNAPPRLLQRTFGNRWRALEFELVSQQVMNDTLRQALNQLPRDAGPYYSAVYYEAEHLRLLRRMALTMGLDPRNEATRGVRAGSPEQPRRVAGIGRSVALVIGTSEYGSSSGWTRLSNPTVDAAAVAHELEQSYGFETRLLIDPSKGDIQAAIHDLRRAPFDSTDEVLIFFAGHGYYHEGMNMGFLVSKDSRALDVDPYLDSYLSYGNLAPWIDAIPSRHVLVVVDACFGGTFDQAIRLASSRGPPASPYPDMNADEFIARKMRLRTRQYLTSGGKEYVPDGRPGMHSPFAWRFLEALREPGPDGILTMSELRAALEKVTPEPRAGGWGQDEPGSDFLFVLRQRQTPR